MYGTIWCDNMIDYVRNHFDEDTNKPIIDAANMILNSWSILQEESSTEEVSEDTTSENEDDGSHSETEIEVGSHDERGESIQEDEEPLYFFTKADPSIDLLVRRFEKTLLNTNVNIPCFKNLMDYVHKHYNMSQIWTMCRCGE